MDSPAHITGRGGVIVTEGNGLTCTVMVLVVLQLALAVAVILYTVVLVGYASTVLPDPEESVDVGVHAYVAKLPDATS